MAEYLRNLPSKGTLRRDFSALSVTFPRDINLTNIFMQSKGMELLLASEADFQSAEEIEQRLGEIDEHLAMLTELSESVQNIRANKHINAGTTDLDPEELRSNAYKALIKKHPSLNEVKFDEDGDGIITNKEFDSVWNNEFDSKTLERKVLEEELKTAAPLHGLLEKIKDDFTTRGLMDNDPAALSNIGVIPTGALDALSISVEFAQNQDKKKGSNTIWMHVILLQKQIDELYTRAEEYDRLADEAQARMDEIQVQIDENSSFIDTTDNLIKNYDTYGNLDREAALFVLQERGVQIGESASDDDIINKLEAEADKSSHENVYLEKEYEATKQDRDRYKEWARDLRERAVELHAKMESVQALPEDEKNTMLKALRKEHSVSTAHKLKNVNEDKEIVKKVDATALDHNKSSQENYVPNSFLTRVSALLNTDFENAKEGKLSEEKPDEHLAEAENSSILDFSHITLL